MLRNLLRARPAMLASIVWTSASLLAPAGCVGQAGDGSELEASAPPGERLAALDHDLTIGSTGDDVRAVHAYLGRYGYFPNDDLARKYPAWRPLVATPPADAAIYDGHTALAIQHLQANMELTVTGVVDAPTRAVMKVVRCGVPEGIPPLDLTDKFAQGGSTWNKTTITWRLLNNDDVTLAQAQSAIAAAFASWSAQTSLSFVQLASGTPDIQLQFAPIDGPGNIGAQTGFPADGGDMTIDTAETWSVASPTPAGAIDLQTVVLHELGHALGLALSSLTSASMYPNYQGPNHFLGLDDKVGVSSLYDTFVQVPGAAKDIAIGSNGAVWVVGTNAFGNGFQAYRWNGAGWDGTDGGGVRVAIDGFGRPWLVGANGAIYRRDTSATVDTGVWTRQPGLARDVGAGADGSVWIIGTNATPGGNEIYKFNGTGWDLSDGGALRITVGPDGVPWVVNINNHIFQKQTNSPFIAGWNELSGVSVDVGINGGNYLWGIAGPVSGGAANVAVWDQQAAFGTAPAEALFVRGKHVGIGGLISSVAVDTNGDPWVVDDNGNIFRTAK